MITLRPAADRGDADHGWLHSRHSFSFAEYFDPRFMGYSVLRVINDDRVGPGAGFPTHPHRDMEIISYVLEGAMEHRDTIGNGGIIRAGDVQRMSAGTGIAHSEFNASDTDPLHFLQIWIVPNRNGHSPSYEQQHFEHRPGQLHLIGSENGERDSLSINQDVRIYAGRFNQGDKAELTVDKTRKIYVHVARGSILLNSITMKEGDGAYVESLEVLEVAGINDGEVLIFDMPNQAS